jgi:hypothetical protein
MLGARVTGQQLVMVGKRGWQPGRECVNKCITAGADNFGRQMMQPVKGDR